MVKDSAIKTILRQSGAGGQPGNWPALADCSLFHPCQWMDRNSAFCHSWHPSPEMPCFGYRVTRKEHPRAAFLTAGGTPSPQAPVLRQGSPEHLSISYVSLPAHIICQPTLFASLSSYSCFSLIQNFNILFSLRLTLKTWGDLFCLKSYSCHRYLCSKPIHYLLRSHHLK